MAKTNTLNLSFNVASAVSARVEAFKKSRSDLQVKEELAYLTQVSDKGLSYADQLAFRQGQLEREESRNAPDPEYIASLKKEIGTLKQSVRFDKIRNGYKKSLLAVTEGKKSLDSHLAFLENQMSEVNDPTLREEIQKEIQETQDKISQADLSLIENEITLAKNDKSLDLLDKAIADVSVRYAKSLGAGDNVKAQVWDLKLQSLKQSRAEIEVENASNRLVSAKARKASAIGFLQSVNEELGKADTQQPVVINGVRYSSAKDFWNQERDKYISSNFFTDVTKEYKDYIASVSQVNGLVPEMVLKNIQNDFTQLSARPELSVFANRLQMTATDVLSDAVSRTSNAILNRFANDLDYSKALSDLQGLTDKYGIDTTVAMQKVVQDAAKEKGQILQGMLSTINEIMAAKNVTYGQAAAEVFASVEKGEGKLVATSISNNELLKNTPQSLVNAAPQNTKDVYNSPTVPSLSDPAANPPKSQTPQTPGQAAGATIPAPQPQTQPQPQPQPVGQPAAPVAPPTPSGNEYVVQKGDTLSRIAKQYYGNAGKFNVIFEANRDVLKNPNLISVGQKLKIPTL